MVQARLSGDPLTLEIGVGFSRKGSGGGRFQ